MYSPPDSEQLTYVFKSMRAAAQVITDKEDILELKEYYEDSSRFVKDLTQEDSLEFLLSIINQANSDHIIDYYQQRVINKNTKRIVLKAVAATLLYLDIAVQYHKSMTWWVDHILANNNAILTSEIDENATYH